MISGLTLQDQVQQHRHLSDPDMIEVVIMVEAILPKMVAQITAVYNVLATHEDHRRSRHVGMAFCVSALLALQPAPASAVELPALEEQDTIVVTADQAWESDDGAVLNFEGNFELKAPDYYMLSDTAQIHGSVDDPDRILATGAPVTFWVRTEDDEEPTHGQAEQVDYDRNHNLLRLSGKAVLQDDRTVMRSSLLEYNTETQRLVSTGTDGVEIVTQPKRD